MNQLHEDNQVLARKLANQYKVVLDPAQLGQMRMRLFFDCVLPPGSEERLEFEIKWYEVIHRSLDDHFRELNMQKLAGDSGKLVLPPSVDPTNGKRSMN